MPSASGWVPLLAKYEAIDYQSIPALWPDYIRALQALLINSIRCGTSVVWFFEAERNTLSNLARVLPDLVDRRAPYHEAFPFPLSEEDLRTQSMTPVRAAFIRYEGEHVLFMCTRRAFREREPLIVTEMADQVRDALSDYDELIGIRSGFTQAFDRIVVRPEAGFLELHIDLCCPLNTDELAQYCVTYMSRLKSEIRRLSGDTLPWLGEAKNLFPRIAHLYRATDGRVFSLGHATGTKSIKDERMRGRDLDLRDELFHRSGIEAIHGTDAYSIKKGWPSADASNVPSVAILGHFSSAGTPHAAVRHAIIDNCSDPTDFDFVRRKLLG